MQGVCDDTVVLWTAHATTAVAPVCPASRELRRRIRQTNSTKCNKFTDCCCCTSRRAAAVADYVICLLAALAADADSQAPSACPPAVLCSRRHNTHILTLQSNRNVIQTKEITKLKGIWIWFRSSEWTISRRKSFFLCIRAYNICQRRTGQKAVVPSSTPIDIIYCTCVESTVCRNFYLFFIFLSVHFHPLWNPSCATGLQNRCGAGSDLGTEASMQEALAVIHGSHGDEESKIEVW